MEWMGFLAAALGAGLLGGLTALLLSALNVKRPRALAVSLIALALVGGAFGGPMAFDALGGRTMRNKALETMIGEKLAAMPFLARIFADFPSVAENFRARAAQAYAQGGENGFLAELARASRDIGPVVKAYYLPRAQTSDLIRVTRAIVVIAKSLSLRAPMLCYRWLTAGEKSGPVEMAEIEKVAGSGPVREFEEAMDGAITRAARNIPLYDRQGAEGVLKAVGQDVLLRDGIEGMTLLSGEQSVENEAEARKACLTAAELYDGMLGYEAELAAAALRHVARPKDNP